MNGVSPGVVIDILFQRSVGMASWGNGDYGMYVRTLCILWCWVGGKPLRLLEMD